MVKNVNSAQNCQKMSGVNFFSKQQENVTFMYADCDRVGKPKSMLDHNIVLRGHQCVRHWNFFLQICVTSPFTF